MKKKIPVIALSLVLAVGSAQAQPIAFSFAGAWTSVSPGLTSWFSSGGQFAGNIRYNSDLAVVGNSATSTAYQGVSSSMDFTTQGWSGSFNNVKIKILNDYTVSGLAGVTDQFVIFHPATSGNSLPNSLPSFSYGMLNLTDDAGQIFTDTSLPSAALMTSLPLDSMSRTFMLSFQGGKTFASGRITSLSQPSLPTPEPASLLLMATGMAGVALYRRRNPRAA